MGLPPYYLPDVVWLHDLYQIVSHHVNAVVAQDMQLFTKKRSYATHCDARFNGSSKAFAQVRPPQTSIRELTIPIQLEAEIHWVPAVPASKQAVCLCDANALYAHSPILARESRWDGLSIPTPTMLLSSSTQCLLHKRK